MTDQPIGQRRPSYDQTLKRLLLRAHDGFPALVAPGLMWRVERSPELPGQPRQADLVWEVERNNGWRGMLHIEMQTKAASDIGDLLAALGTADEASLRDQMAHISMDTLDQMRARLGVR